MKSATQDRYWPDRLGSWTGGPAQPPPMASKNLGRAFRLANGNFGLFSLVNTHISVCSVWPISLFRSVPSGRYPYFGLFRLAKTHFFVCSVRPIPLFRSVRSCQYPYIGLFGLTKGQVSVCSVWPIPLSLYKYEIKAPQKKQYKCRNDNNFKLHYDITNHLPTSP